METNKTAPLSPSAGGTHRSQSTVPQAARSDTSAPVQARNDESSLDKASSSAPIKEVVQKRGRSRSDAAGPKRGARGQKKGAASNVLEPERMRLPRLLDRDKWEEEAATAWLKGSKGRPRRARVAMGRVEGPKVEKDEIDVMRHIRAEAMVDPSNDTAGFNLFCSKNTPQWFAVQVDQPDPSQAGKVAYYLEGAGNVLPEKVTTGGGTQIQRKIEVLHPKKKVIVPGRKAGSTAMKTVTWREGSYVFFRAIMDTHLIKYLQPFFVEETQFWFQKLRRKPVPPLMTSFVDGLVVNEKYFIPRPVNFQMLEEVQEWLETEEEWSQDQVNVYDEGLQPRNVLMDEIDKVGEEADEEAEAAARGLSGEELRKKQQLQDLEIQEETRRKVRERLEAASRLDPGAWNVGVTEIKRKKRDHTKAGNKGGQASFNRTKFGAAAPQTADRNTTRSDEQWRHIQRQRRSDSSSGTDWYDGSQPSQRRLADAEDDVDDPWSSLDASSSRKEETSKVKGSEMSTRGARRAAGAVRGQEIAARSGWFAPPDDLGIEDEDDWSLLTDNSKAQTPNWERRSDNDSEQSRKPKQAEQRSIRDGIKGWQDDGDSGDNQWYGSEEVPARDSVGGYAEGWYDAAAAASAQYSRPQADGNDWYEGPESSKHGGDQYSAFDSDAWEDWEQETQKQNQEMYAAEDQRLSPGDDSGDYNSNWSFLNEETVPEEPETAGSPESPQDSEEELLNYQVYGGREEASRSSDGSLSSAPSYNSFGGRSEAGSRQGRSRRKGRFTAEKAGGRKEVHSNPLFEWHSADKGPDRRDFGIGSEVSIGGGRFKGRLGKVVNVRDGVLRVQMQSEEGPVEADMAAAHCVAVP